MALFTITYYLTVYQWIDKFQVVDYGLVLLEQFRNIVQFHIKSRLKRQSANLYFAKFAGRSPFIR